MPSDLLLIWNPSVLSSLFAMAKAIFSACMLHLYSVAAIAILYWKNNIGILYTILYDRCV